MTSRERFEAWIDSQPRTMLLASFAVWQAAERQALERAAQICDEVSTDRWNLYKGRAPYTGSEEGRASDYVQGESDGAETCAHAIRALLDAQSKDTEGA
ncbi:hypothetical protein [Caballeronia sp. INDeC2]|uniref:hypothetical protein n=1 Tax=Caballeronia sp. INDeC2 TaxID=2921747 RepID=UPI002028DB66|nr:hypothetical protein [Caballeronia sp. INDeC2]